MRVTLILDNRINSYKEGPDENGRFGVFGGRFVSETLMPLILSLESEYEKVKSDIDRIRHIPSIRPVEGGYLNSSFGYRQDPIDAVRRFHQGQDFSVPTGTPIFAPADGVVKRAYYIGGFGNHIKLSHASGYSTTFAHLSKIFVRHGQKVKRGDVIGETGNTGRSTAPHLHYEVHYKGTPKNPADFFFTQHKN